MTQTTHASEEINDMHSTRPNTPDSVNPDGSRTIRSNLDRRADDVPAAASVINCQELCSIPEGITMSEVPRPRHDWGDALSCPNDGCERAFLVKEAQPEPDVCRPVDVDGKTVLIRGQGDLSEEGQGFVAEVVRAASRRYASEHPEAAQPEPDAEPLTAEQWITIKCLVAWLDAENGRSDDEVGLRILKLTEEIGEVAQAWIGVQGQNPRKGVTHTTIDVQDELVDVMVTAAVALASLTDNPAAVLDAKLQQIAAARVGVKS